MTRAESIPHLRLTASNAEEISVQWTSESLRELAFLNCFAWTLERLSVLFDSKQPKRAAATFVKRQMSTGMLATTIVEVQPVTLADEPLCSSCCRCPNYDQLAYQLEQRFRAAPRLTRVVWPTAEFGKKHGRWAGAKSFPSPHKVSHDVLLAEVWLKLLRRSPTLAIDHWCSERRWEWWNQGAVNQPPIPDALIIPEQGPPIAIEIGGNYSASWIRHHVRQFEAQGWAWELW